MDSRRRRAAAAGGRDERRCQRLGAGNPGTIPRADERRRRGRTLLQRSDRAAGAHPPAAGARARAPALRRVAAPRGSPHRRASAAADGVRAVHGDRDGSVRRARPRELLATGEKVRKRSAETRDDLTGQERQIAQLARDGLSNPESAPGSSSAHAPSSGICVRCSGSSGSARAEGCVTR